MAITRRWWFFTIFILGLSALWIWYSAQNSNELKTAQASAPAVGFSAPNFELSNLHGGQVQLSNLRGQAIIINFWASWCPPCKSEMPALQRVFSEYANRDFSILAINATNIDSISEADQFIQDNHLTFPVLIDSDGAVSNLYRADSLPTSYFIDRTGTIQEIIIGGPLSEALLKTRIEKLLGNN